ncbi:MAG: hypothetical protein ABI183_18510 [Polyangiaceae bacterium]
MADEQTKKNTTIVKVVGIGAGLALITVGTIIAPKLGNYSVLVVAAGVSVAVFSYVAASLRSTKQ